jgi:anti-anti-sigma regulatory factor
MINRQAGSMRSSGATIVATRMRSSVVVTAPTNLGNGALEDLCDVALRSFETGEATSLILELSGVNFMDTYEFSRLKALADTVRFLGVKTIFVGLNAGIISHLSHSNAEVSGVLATLGLDEALTLVNA